MDKHVSLFRFSKIVSNLFYRWIDHPLQARQKWIVEELDAVMESRSHIIFVECINNNPEFVDSNIRTAMGTMPDYKNMDEDEAIADFKQRIRYYENSYETIDDDSYSYIKNSTYLIAPPIVCFLPKTFTLPGTSLLFLF